MSLTLTTLVKLLLVSVKWLAKIDVTAPEVIWFSKPVVLYVYLCECVINGYIIASL